MQGHGQDPTAPWLDAQLDSELRLSQSLVHVWDLAESLSLSSLVGGLKTAEDPYCVDQDTKEGFRRFPHFPCVQCCMSPCSHVTNGPRDPPKFLLLVWVLLSGLANLHADKQLLGLLP